MPSATSKPRTERTARLDDAAGEPRLSERQAMVLRALVAAYVGQAGPVASGALSQLLPTSLSPASVRNTLGELHEAGLIDKAHASAGRVPTAAGLALFVGRLLEVGHLGPHQQRLLARELEGVDVEATPRQASHLLSEHTRQLGFVVAPRVDQLTLSTLHLVPVGEHRILAVLVARNGGVIERTIDHPERLSARDLERIRALLAERVEGRSLAGLRRLLESERRRLRGEADALLERAWVLGLEACHAAGIGREEDLVIATRMALLDQPEFADPERIRGLFSAIETNERLLELLREVARGDRDADGVGLSISLGALLGEPALRDCALVAMPYGRPSAATVGPVERPFDGGIGRTLAGRSADVGRTDGAAPVGSEAAGEENALGVLGVIGPQRMDYGRVIPLVRYCSELVTEKLLA